MSRLSHFKLGLFLVVCAAAGAVALIWLGATRIFESTRTYVAFFDQPVSGLDSGAPVKHLGVRIGSVDSVELAPGDKVVRVVVKLKSGFHLDPAMALAMDQAGITGSPYLALDDTPEGERREPAHPPTKHPILPTRSGGGGMGAAMAAVQDVAHRLTAVLDSGDIESTLRDVHATAQELKTATTAIAGQMQGLKPGTAAEIASRIERTTDLGEQAMRHLDGNVGASAALLRQDLSQLRQAVAEAQSLARSLRAEPSRIIEKPAGGDPFTR